MKDDNELEFLLKENERLKNELLSIRTKEEKKSKIKRWILKKSARVVAGKNLSKSFLQLYSELPNDVTKESLAEVSASIIWRITRIGFFALLLSIIPLLILVLQTIILK